ncbi:MAG: BON domain-containing protein [Candidatus Competibacter sp.]|nr:BON domain-containing protein [Candidatus Competibacter sp.]
MTKFHLSLALLIALATAGCSALNFGGRGGSDSDSSSTATLSGGRGGAKASDSDITSSVKAAFKDDPELAAANISVSAESGVVTLSGNVPNAQSYNRAISLARGVPGVRPPVRAANLNFPQ